MMRALLQQQGSSAEAMQALKVLLEQQGTVTAELAVAQRQLQVTQTELAGGNGKAAERAAEEGVRVAQLQRAADELGRRISAAEGAAMGGNVSVGVGDARTGVAVVPPRRDGMFRISSAEFGGLLALLFIIPLVVGLSRWIWRRTSAPLSTLDGSPQLARLEQAVEAIAIEVERIGEAQRFSAKLLAERPVEAQAEPAAKPPRSRRPVITPVP
jgi:hypothetical protein